VRHLHAAVWSGHDRRRRIRFHGRAIGRKIERLRAGSGVRLRANALGFRLRLCEDRLGLIKNRIGLGCASELNCGSGCF
jgi:hypothetical protein